MITISALSTEYIKVQVAAIKAGKAIDPTKDDVSIAFVNDPPQPADWHGATWETADTTYLARCLVGPAGGVTTLTPGTYDVWVQIIDSPELPIKKAGRLDVTP